MNAQFRYGIIDGAWTFAIASIIPILAYLNDTIGEKGLLAAVVALLATWLRRAYKGWQDGQRNIHGDIIPSDVTPTVANPTVDGPTRV